jgi:hypothetical protein
LQGFSEAAEGTRTLDLLHGKQWLDRVFPLSKRIRGVGDSRGLPAITVDSGNELVMVRSRPGPPGSQGPYPPGFVARIVEPMAPNFSALRRVSSKVERA